MKPRGSSLKRTVQVRVGELELPTYLPAAPDKNPMFLERRVYQGSSGRVYPLPFTDRIAIRAVPRRWRAIWIENEYLRALVLPELGGRIHALQDKTNGYDLIYRQDVIKPALVGLAGPWISGGIEFNWPQHHRPATFLPVDVEVEEHEDGSKTIWCSDHDPMARMIGMHGVCLHPGRAYLELKVRVHNRTLLTQTFLWWANVATRVHEAYQSFFPPDVHAVADHARRSMSEFPFCQGRYYGVDYGERGRTGVPEAEWPSQYAPLLGAKEHPTPKPSLRPARATCGRREPGPISYAPNDLSFYANIPVPTSYMCLGSEGDFFGGYDHRVRAGLVHFADHHIAPGKKQWTWGNHEFGYAWDRNLTDPDAKGECAPYIELMAGVYTDNQPDFSFLQPGDTKLWSQFWYPIREIGPVQHATLEAAVSLRLTGRILQIGVCVTQEHRGATVCLRWKDKPVAKWRRNLSPKAPFLQKLPLPRRAALSDLTLEVTASDGRELLRYAPRKPQSGPKPAPATEPPPPDQVRSADELFLTGLHLEQYRHATRSPTDYWREALRRDPLDARCNQALGQWHLRRGEFEAARACLQRAVERLTARNANPADGEALYYLGLCERYLGCDNRAYDAFYKATWNAAWAGPARVALAEIDAARQDWPRALEHLEVALSLDSNQLRARNLAVIVLRRLSQLTSQNLDRDLAPNLDPAAFPGSRVRAILLTSDALKSGPSPDVPSSPRDPGAGRGSRRGDASPHPSPPLLRKRGRYSRLSSVNPLESLAETLLRETLRRDPLDWWARHLAGQPLACDLQTALDLAHDYARAGCFAEAIDVLDEARPKAKTRDLPDQSWGALPLVHYTLGWLEERRGRPAAARREYRRAERIAPDYCFPARLEEIQVLEAALRANPKDARAAYYLGNLLYDRRRHDEAIRFWERSARRDPTFSIVWRNLGIGYYNVRRQRGRARAAYEKAFRANPSDARLLYERDQLWKRLGVSPQRRLREFLRYPELVEQRDDLSLELASLLNSTGRFQAAADCLARRQFQPWEGGEGGPLREHVRAQLALSRAALARGAAAAAVTHARGALEAPRNLGEAKHLLANQSDVHFWLGCAYAEAGKAELARDHWRLAANFKGDFQEMRIRAFSEMTYYSASGWKRLGQPERARSLFRELLSYARQLRRAPAKIDYFATSLPTMLLFEDDLAFRQETAALFLEAQAQFGLGRRAAARALMKTVLRRDPNHSWALDFEAGLCQDERHGPPPFQPIRGVDSISPSKPSRPLT